VIRLISIVAAALLAGAHASGRPVVVGAEHDIAGFNTSLSCCDDQWASWMGAEEALRGAFGQAPNGRWLKELVSAASASGAGVTYTIKANAFWYWGGRKVPVTYRDFVYTLQQIDDPNNQIADRSGYANLDPTRYRHSGTRRVTFFWKTANCTADFPCGRYGNWQSLFSSLYPSFALRGMNFNTIWTSCICGNDGKPVADGPYYVSRYTRGVGSVLEANPFWAGAKPSVREIDFKVLSGTAAEVQAVQGHQVDVIAPTFGAYLGQVKNTAGFTFSEIAGYEGEHLEFREGTGASNALLRAPFIRQAIALATDRTSIVNAVYGDLASGAPPTNDALYFPTEAEYRPDFKQWNFNPAKALALMSKRCTGGPVSLDPANTAIWQCSGLPTTFSWTWPAGDTVGAVTEAIVKAELRAIGIQIVDRPVPANVFYGSTGIASGDFDIAEFVETAGGDPGDWYDSYRCGGPANFTGFCSRKVDELLAAGARETDPARRARDYQAADKALAGAVPVLPLYQRPAVLVRRATLAGVVDNAGPSGPFWDVERWRWGR
jgi:ABC-type transport system substrate-binding protein